MASDCCTHVNVNLSASSVACMQALLAPQTAVLPTAQQQRPFALACRVTQGVGRSCAPSPMYHPDASASVLVCTCSAGGIYNPEGKNTGVLADATVPAPVACPANMTTLGKRSTSNRACGMSWLGTHTTICTVTTNCRAKEFVSLKAHSLPAALQVCGPHNVC